ncbi:hypothetical protein [Bradyrhizobium sp. USDA 3458]|uniref:hypothetical protein n=1 Tax=Bradyrhizobium sp. USDA 3458 TaxID=2591461 RepID=UPI001144DE32|nr:hypothetical protein [Bradyrhizobium sp. USDA 3458]
MKKHHEQRADEIAQRCAELAAALAVTTLLGQHLEMQRNAMVDGAASALGLLKLVASGAGTVEDRTGAILALSQWLTDISASVIVPISWAGIEQVVKH